MKRTKQSTFAKRERSEKSTRFAPVGSEAMIHKHTYSIPSADDQNDARCIECGQLQPTTPHATHTPEDVIVYFDLSDEQWDALPNEVIVKLTGVYVRNAAAPAMYEAGKPFIEESNLFEVIDDGGGERYVLTVTKAEYAALRAALAQAEGKQ